MEIPEPRTARAKQIEALFDEFVGMGPARSYGKLARKHGIEAPELMRHARAFLWGERINALQLKHNEATSAPVDPDDEAGAEELNRLHLTRLKFVQKKAMDYLENAVFDKPADALRMLVDSMKLEREIKGLTKDKHDDLKSILLKKLREAGEEVDSPGDFDYDPEMEIEELDDKPPETNGRDQRDSAAPSGGSGAE